MIRVAGSARLDKASVLAIGTELTTGQIVNRNAAWISEKLTDIGLDVALHEIGPAYSLHSRFEMQTFSPCNECRKLNRVPIDSKGTTRPICGNCKADLPVHGALNELSASGLQLLIEKSPLPVVVDFWAPWCAPCKVMAPSFEAAARQFADQAVFVKVDTQAHPLAADLHSIRAAPTLIVFQGGLERARQSGALPPEILQQWLRSNLAASRAA